MQREVKPLSIKGIQESFMSISFLVIYNDRGSTFQFGTGDWKLSQLRRKSEIYLYLPSVQNCFSRMVESIDIW
jgi:hypothetical protein